MALPGFLLSETHSDRGKTVVTLQTTFLSTLFVSKLLWMQISLKSVVSVSISNKRQPAIIQSMRQVIMRTNEIYLYRVNNRMIRQFYVQTNECNSGAIMNRFICIYRRLRSRNGYLFPAFPGFMITHRWCFQDPVDRFEWWHQIKQGKLLLIEYREIRRKNVSFGQSCMLSAASGGYGNFQVHGTSLIWIKSSSLDGPESYIYIYIWYLLVGVITKRTNANISDNLSNLACFVRWWFTYNRNLEFGCLF